MIDDKLIKNLSELLVLSLEGDISKQQFEELQNLTSGNSEALSFCVDFTTVWANLSGLSSISLEKVCDTQTLTPETLDNLMQELAEVEETAITVDVERPTEDSVEPWQGLIKVEKPKRMISRLSIYTLALSAAAMLFLMILVLSSPIRPVVATLTDSINAEWVSEEEIPTDGDPLRQGELTLAKGLAEITFGDGAVVTVEAPAVIDLESPKSMFVTRGKISAVVSKYATGFTVNTLSGSIVDLGTEFGVNVESEGSCSLHMFKGMASLIVGQKGKVRTSQIVNANEARRVDFVTGEMEDIVLGEKSFVRRIDSEKRFVWRGEGLNLADVVGDGNGFGKTVKPLAIDPVSGNIERTNRHMRRYGNKFIPIRYSDYVDGVFIPDGGKGEVLISSAGHIFEDCPDTDGDTTFDISNFGPLVESDGSEWPMIHNAIEYGKQGYCAIMMHSNAGITFNLNEIRRQMPFGINITGFNAICAFSEIVKEEWPMAEFWVLVDGETKFTKRIGPKSETEQAEVLIEDSDSFLTLVITDGGNTLGDHTISHSFDFCFWANPVLRVEQLD